MQDIKISELVPLTSIRDGDFFPIVNSGSLTTYRTDIATLNAWMTVSGSALSSSHANTSSYVKVSVSSSYASQADYALLANTASYVASVSNSGTSISASHALIADNSINAASAVSASYSDSSFSSSHSNSSSYAEASGHTVTASYSETASWALNVAGGIVFTPPYPYIKSITWSNIHDDSINLSTDDPIYTFYNSGLPAAATNSKNGSNTNNQYLFAWGYYTSSINPSIGMFTYPISSVGVNHSLYYNTTLNKYNMVFDTLGSSYGLNFPVLTCSASPVQKLNMFCDNRGGAITYWNVYTPIVVVFALSDTQNATYTINLNGYNGTTSTYPNCCFSVLTLDATRLNYPQSDPRNYPVYVDPTKWPVNGWGNGGHAAGLISPFPIRSIVVS